MCNHAQFTLVWNPRALHMPGMNSATELYPELLFLFLYRINCRFFLVHFLWVLLSLKFPKEPWYPPPQYCHHPSAKLALILPDFDPRELLSFGLAIKMLIPTRPPSQCFSLFPPLCQSTWFTLVFLFIGLLIPLYWRTSSDAWKNILLKYLDIWEKYSHSPLNLMDHLAEFGV